MQTQLTKQERQCLNQLIANTTHTALELGMTDDVIQELMEIIATAYTLGIVTAKSEIQEPCPN